MRINSYRAFTPLRKSPCPVAGQTQRLMGNGSSREPLGAVSLAAWRADGTFEAPLAPSSQALSPRHQRHRDQYYEEALAEFGALHSDANIGSRPQDVVFQLLAIVRLSPFTLSLVDGNKLALYSGDLRYVSAFVIVLCPVAG